jgi:hypothetical protein
MRKRGTRVALAALVTGATLAGALSDAASPDGTIGLADLPDPDPTDYPAHATPLPYSEIVMNPVDSVSMTGTQVWRENRHRAYQNPGIGIEDLVGYLLFDVSSVPDDASITELTLTCYLENAFASPYQTPVVDVHYVGHDRWRRATVAAGELVPGPLLLDDVAFPAYEPSHRFVLPPLLHDWSVDLQDDHITFAFRNDVAHHSYVYFYGAGGTPEGTPPELRIRYERPVASDAARWGRLKTLYR